MLPWLKTFCQDVPVMPQLCLLLIYLCVLIGVEPELFKFIQLEGSSFSTCLGIRVEFLDCPICFVFQLKWQIACFSKHNPIRCHSYWCFKSCRYAHRASSSLLAQSFLVGLTTFSRILLISMLEISACPLVCGW